MNKEGFSKWFSRTMELQGVSGRQIARNLGKDEGQVSGWKNGKSVPNPDECLRIGAMLEVENPLRLLVNAGHISKEVAERMNITPLPPPEYNPERERMKRKIRATGAPRESWDEMLAAWERSQQ